MAELHSWLVAFLGSKVGKAWGLGGVLGVALGATEWELVARVAWRVLRLILAL